jgi:uncharacterized protein DUF6949
MARTVRGRQDSGSFAAKGRAFMSPETFQMVLALLLGFAVAGLCTSGYQLATRRLPSFNLLSQGPSVSAFSAVALLIFAAPFLIMRNILTTRSARRASSAFSSSSSQP